jgi:hypothetical protein
VAAGFLLATLELPRPGIAEDAPPLALAARDAALLGVFDGLGGAGARAVDGEDGRRSSAYYAARTARAATAAAFAGGGRGFAAAIASGLAERQRTAPVAAGALRGAMLRSYPTTAAILLIEPAEVTAHWAGDSRCYALSPAAGLQQLSLDDTPAADPMRALGDDGPMTNLLCADRPGRLHAARRRTGDAAILLVATDGAYASFPSPMHFELALLDALAGARGPEEWTAALAARIAPLADDDVSLAAAFAGWAPDRFADRRARLARLLDASPAAAWERYRARYMALAGGA